MLSRRRRGLSQVEVTILQWIMRLAVAGCLVWSIWTQAWFYVIGNVIVGLMLARNWRSD